MPDQLPLGDQGDDSARRGTPPDRPPILPDRPAAIEWRAASPAGEQFGPTVPVLFAQWIREGRIGPDWLVWRSDWPDWRTAAEAGPDLPAPLVGIRPRAAAPPSQVAAPPARVAPPAVTGPLSPQRERTSTTEYSQRRKQVRRRQTLIAAVLLALVLIMVTVLVVLLTSG
ncbi:DUF4339 domain-containing protein [Botrimarina hoheduenensis]|uniref:GYF domain-containing protein n=1 Tax=Botrimarina hoheduenensis TaxID=2528000 RepID=A0A5C5WB21_9BACT|nr:DUF4339 domain-containing protein [Botrimarina hoheduenensis]TWT47279.1 hypothetical protein Pla111_08920 [Botrimarina hoheduenensis]